MRLSALPLMLPFLLLFPTLNICLPADAADPALLLHWNFDEQAGEPARDLSGNGLDGQVSAARVPSPSGGALHMDGTPRSLVEVTLPEALRFGRESWSLSLWLKPAEFHIDARQNLRRIFSYGEYPAACLVADISGEGRAGCYLCYRDENGKTVDTGAGHSQRMQLGEWAHLALVVDREQGTMRFYLNGYGDQPSPMREGFAGDFKLGGKLSIGSGWQNYSGLADEVRIHRRALSPQEIRAEFLRLNTAFGVAEPPKLRLERIMDEIDTLWTAGDFAAASDKLQSLVDDESLPPHYRSYAALRRARCLVAAADHAGAADLYAHVAATAAYPLSHRLEAGELAGETRRAQQGLPARDPAAGRTRLARFPAFAAEIHLAPSGDDERGDGSAERPFASLTRALSHLRTLERKALPFCITLAPGRYPLRETVRLGEQDGGTPAAPLIIRCAQKGGAVLYGGARLADFAPVSDPAILDRLPPEARGKVYQCDLRAQGITDFGELGMRGFGKSSPPPTLELFFNGAPQTLARWPDTGFVGIRELVEPGSLKEGRPSVIGYDDERHARWQGAKDAWLFGYFRYLWADSTIMIGAVDPQARTLSTAPAYNFDGQGMEDKQGIIYYAFNLLEELDRPGEWYLDRTSGILYLLPPGDIQGATVEIGLLSGPLLALEKAAHVRLEGIHFDLGRADGVAVKDSRDIVLAGCTISRMAANGVVVRGGERCGLLGCDVRLTGRSGTELVGGDRASLTPAGHFVENCRIHDFGRIDRTYTPAVGVEGVGNRVAYCLLYNAPSSVLRLGGNDHVFEYNEIHSAVTESDDQGAIDMWGNPFYRGNIFRFNFFHHIGKTGTEPVAHGQAAIRFDDVISDQLAYGNILYRCSNGNFGAVQMNSGRDNVIDNNLFIDCKYGVTGGWHPRNKFWLQLREGTYRNDADRSKSEVYLARYPGLAQMLDDNGLNHLWRNLFVAVGQGIRSDAQRLDVLANLTLPAQEQGGEGRAKRAREEVAGIIADLVSGAKPADRIAFRRIPLEEIGLYEDYLRASWPVEVEPTRPAQMREK